MVGNRVIFEDRARRLHGLPRTARSAIIARLPPMSDEPRRGKMREYLSPASDSRRWRDFSFRAGDVVISSPPKCGTTWTQMLVALLVFDGPDFPGPLSVVSPWLDNELTSLAVVTGRLAGQQHRRFIKTHVPLDGLPWDDNVHYVVVARDPRDAYLSLMDHGDAVDWAGHDAVLVANLGEEELDRRSNLSPLPETFAEAIEMPRGRCPTRVHPAHILHHFYDAWTRRGNANVSLIHYADMRADATAVLTGLARDLGFDYPRSRLAKLASFADFTAMRTRAPDLTPEVDHWRDPAKFFAAGRLGQWRSSFTEADLGRYQVRAEELYPDEEFLGWVHTGSAGGEWRIQ
jgi:aryl sulfotransferase